MFSNSLFRRRAGATGKKPLFTWHEEVREVWRQTIRKAALYGDPYAAWRKTGELPAEFEYGMNCFIDRIFETEGKELAQQVYEEMKQPGYCIVRHTRDSFDVKGVPVLFNVSSIDDALASVSKLASRFSSEKFNEVRRAAMNLKIFDDEPILPPGFFKGSGKETSIRMNMLSIALEARSGDKDIESPQIMSLYASIIIDALPVDERELDEPEVMWSLWVGNLLALIIPARLGAVQKLLKQLEESFWRMLWAAFMEYFKRYQGGPGPVAKLQMLANAVEVEKLNQYRGLNDEEYWNYAYRRFTQSGFYGDVAAVVASAVVLKRRPQHSSLHEAVRGDDSEAICHFLLRKCYDQSVNTV